jgi:hypothetical protein
MAIYDYVDALAEAVEREIWATVPTIAEQAGVTVPDALNAAKRVLLDRIKAIKPTHGVDYRDDGRAALWRVRMQIWEGESLFADTDEGPPSPEALSAQGKTLIYGLPEVARWALELIRSAHPEQPLDGVDEATLLGKLRTVRVALSNQGGACAWRIRYAAWPAPVLQETAERPSNLLKMRHAQSPSPRHFMAMVRLSREERAPGAHRP